MPCSDCSEAEGDTQSDALAHCQVRIATIWEVQGWRASSTGFQMDGTAQKIQISEQIGARTAMKKTCTQEHFEFRIFEY